jgi:hypothetical protein
VAEPDGQEGEIVGYRPERDDAGRRHLRGLAGRLELKLAATTGIYTRKLYTRN